MGGNGILILALIVIQRIAGGRAADSGMHAPFA
jgi:hypothetical protein